MDSSANLSKVQVTVNGHSFWVDTCVADVVLLHLLRAQMGEAKYGTTMDRQDLSPSDWSRMAMEECMDAAIYLNKLVKTLGTIQNAPKS